MIRPRRLADIDRSQRDWLDARHHFVVTPQGNPNHTPVGPLIVWNDDTIAPGRGFPSHSHANLEIVTWVIDGAIEHWDNEGNRGRDEAGDVQVMSAGAGITHEEKAHTATPTRLFQLWLLPRTPGKPTYWKIRPFPEGGSIGALTLLASGYDEPGAVLIDADARILAATIAPGGSIDYPLAAGEAAYLVIAKGRLLLEDEELGQGDGAVVEAASALHLLAIEETKVLVVVVTQ
jgi:redox-sensitive bicupin YhaK (pirin superfamily)